MNKVDNIMTELLNKGLEQHINDVQQTLDNIKQNLLKEIPSIKPDDCEKSCKNCAWNKEQCDVKPVDGDNCPDYQQSAEIKTTFKQNLYGDSKWRALYLYWKEGLKYDSYEFQMTLYNLKDDEDYDVKKLIVFHAFQDLYEYNLLERVNVSSLVSISLTKAELNDMCTFVFSHYYTMLMKSRRFKIFDNTLCDILYHLYFYIKNDRKSGEFADYCI